MTDQQQPAAACPQCGPAGGALTARQAYEDREGTLGGPPPALVAPPPPPAPVANTAGTAWFVIGGLLAAKGVFDLLSPHPELVGASDAYRAGNQLGGLVPAGVLLAIGLFRRWRGAGKAGAGQLEHGRWQRRTAVWEQARLCRGCRTAFWPAGALGPGFEASPSVPLERFPLTVVGLAEHPPGAPSTAPVSAANQP
ncbi:hypothetical protein AB0K43_16005 [Kitasatospora sp. NPDC049258]|uniref:hypothetical protein n=1 Tax=Kitasatospora sp. NPDC049258 TaxID=3155394 RepID=UPI003424CC2F